MKLIAVATALAAAFVLTACGKGDSPSSNGSPAVTPAGFSGSYKSSDGKTTFHFNGGKLHMTSKVSKGYEYPYTVEDGKVKWVYEGTQLAESCEIKSSTTLYCTAAHETLTKFD